ncbi:IS200/IS605 family transposase [Salinibacter ruber]|uniref:IS200/IS605 family transposase n=1 Tax=Salinibacter ruber TaxID=146919 RepID=UPI002168F442|nr:IS200/IS605 family transposase [Salinibacter ruber]MCS4142430.1 putative transposase [Salinibacter ruber]
MSKYRRGAHTIYEIKYHLVWVTKYRYRVLTGEVAHRARELVRQTCLSLDVRIEKGHVSKDHVYVLVSSPPTVSPSKLMQRIKGRSSRKLQQEFAHLRKRYWGRHFWARGYFRATSVRVTDEQIKDYIEGHDEEPPDPEFTIDT